MRKRPRTSVASLPTRTKGRRRGGQALHCRFRQAKATAHPDRGTRLVPPVAPYLCSGTGSSAGLCWLGGRVALLVGGEWLRVGRCGCSCARAPSLILVRGPWCWGWVGDMMVDGVIPLGKRCGRSVYARVGGGRSMPGAGRGASV